MFSDSCEKKLILAYGHWPVASDRALQPLEFQKKMVQFSLFGTLCFAIHTMRGGTLLAVILLLLKAHVSSDICFNMAWPTITNDIPLIF